MKTKLTLSVDRRKLAKLRRVSARKGISISAMVESLADKLDEERATATGEGIARLFGSLKLPPEAFEEDSRYGAELRKTEYYERMMKAKHKRA